MPSPSGTRGGEGRRADGAVHVRVDAPYTKEDVTAVLGDNVTFVSQQGAAFLPTLCEPGLHFTALIMQVRLGALALWWRCDPCRAAWSCQSSLWRSPRPVRWGCRSGGVVVAEELTDFGWVMRRLGGVAASILIRNSASGMMTSRRWPEAVQANLTRASPLTAARDVSPGSSAIPDMNGRATASTPTTLFLPASFAAYMRPSAMSTNSSQVGALSRLRSATPRLAVCGIRSGRRPKPAWANLATS